MAPSATQSLGARAETVALRHMRQHGLALLRRNFSCRLGEIDLILLDGETLVFTEVRYRSAGRLVDALLTVDHRKQAKLVRAAGVFMKKHPMHARRVSRFDVIAIDVLPNMANRLTWVRDAFRPN